MRVTLPALSVLTATLTISTAVGQCPPTWTHVGFHQENTGAALVGNGDEAYVGSFGSNGGSGAGRLEPHPDGTWIFSGGFGGTGSGAVESGSSIDVLGDLGVVGDPRDTTLFAAPLGQGAFEIAERVNGVWTTIATHYPPAPQALMRFGEAVDISEDGTTICVSAPGESGATGAVYVYSKLAGIWTPTAYIKPPSIGSGDRFGESCRIVGGRLFVGAPNFGGGGAVFVFEWSSGSWNQTALLVPAGTQAGDSVGHQLVGSGDTILVAAPLRATAAGSGVIVRFDRVGGAWVEGGALEPFGAGPVGYFGNALELQDDRLAVGAGGNAFVFEDAGLGWEPLARVDQPGGISNAQFGASVALVDDGVLVGAPYFDDTGLNYPDHMGGIFAFDLTDAGQPFVACGHAIPISGGGSQKLVLDAGAYSNQSFLILGSATGTTPTFVSGVTVPLTPDPYFFLTIALPGGPTLPGGSAALDAAGYAEAEFVLPPGLSPALVGLTIHHAFVTYAPGIGPTFASNDVGVTLVP